MWSIDLLAFLALLFISSCFATGRNFTLSKEIRGQDFFNEFYWWDYTDPTHGYVDYVSKSDARSLNLSYVNAAGNFVMQVDNTTILDAGSTQGRKSIRIHSNDLMKDGILLVKINWMPQGCGTWPAFWTCTTEQWPIGGEIDIIEGANDQGPLNLASLHTDLGCSIPGAQSTLRNDTGFSSQTNCTDQPGCSIGFSQANSFGPDFNSIGGGYFAMVRDTAIGGQGISIYFWPASTSSQSIPTALLDSPLPYLTTSTNVTSLAYSTQNARWLTPAAHFPNSNSSCEMAKYYDAHNIIFDTTLCGSWAGNTFQYNSACPNVTCQDYVASNASAFSDARWEIEYLRVYTDPSDSGTGQLSNSALLASSATATTLLVFFFLS